MNNYFIQFVLGQNDGGAGGIIELLILFVLVVAGIIRSLFAAKQTQNQKRTQKKPIQRPTAQKAPATAEKLRMQRERYEQFLENILQPRRPSKHQPSKPTTQRPQPAGNVPVPVPVKTPQVVKVYTNESSDTELYQEMSAPVRKAEIDTILDKKIIKIDNQLEQIPQLQEEHIQEDQRHLIFHDKMSEKTSGKKLSSALPSFSDSDDLKKAILYTEILGKPISLRESEALFD